MRHQKTAPGIPSFRYGMVLAGTTGVVAEMSFSDRWTFAPANRVCAPTAQSEAFREKPDTQVWREALRAY